MLKMVLIQTRDQESYTFWSHNLEQGDAAREAQELRQRKIEVLTLDQAESHEVVDPELCGECQTQLDQYLAKQEELPSQRDESFEG